jgi:hypothetical protein
MPNVTVLRALIELPSQLVRCRETGLRTVGLVLLLLGLLSCPAAAQQPAGAARPASGADRPAPEDSRGDARATEQLIGQLDAARYELRNQATRALTDQGVAAVPHLVRALDSTSRETRFRVGQLLRQGFAFEEIGPPLLQFARQSDNRLARSILYERALRQLDEVAQMPSVERLFEFWGTSLGAFRRQILSQLDAPRPGADLRDSITPLLEISSKAEQFADAITRLEKLSLAYDNRYSAAHGVARTLARGLRSDNRRAIRFAGRYLESLESLVGALQQQGSSPGAIRKEVGERAVFSQGAAEYLSRLITDPNGPHQVELRAAQIAPEDLADEFFQGLAASDRRQCYLRVGKVHIADMMTELLVAWPKPARDAHCGRLIEAVAVTVRTGDKPKALALLDALEGCRELPEHEGATSSQLDRQLSERLCQGALSAATNRSYHPTRAMHDRILSVLDCGVGPDHAAFPRRLVDAYLAGRPDATAERRRLALQRYATMLRRLQSAELPYDGTGVQSYLAAMRAGLIDDPQRLRRGLDALDQLLPSLPNGQNPVANSDVDAALGRWTAQLDTSTVR